MDKQNVTYTMDYLSVQKRKEIFIHATWMKDIMLNKISPSQRPIHKILYDPSCVRSLGSQIHRERKEHSGCQWLGGGSGVDEELLFNGCRVLVGRLRTSRVEEGDNCPSM